MKTFVLSALAAVVSAEPSYQELKVTVDGSVHRKHFKGLHWFENGIPIDSDGFRAHIHNNNNMLLKNSEWDGVGYAFRPWLKGGHI